MKKYVAVPVTVNIGKTITNMLLSNGIVYVEILVFLYRKAFSSSFNHSQQSSLGYCIRSLLVSFGTSYACNTYTYCSYVFALIALVIYLRLIIYLRYSIVFLLSWIVGFLQQIVVFFVCVFFVWIQQRGDCHSI